MLAEPPAPSASVFLRAARHYARGQALVATGDVVAADRELADLVALLPDKSLDQPLFSPNSGRAILAVGPPALAGEIAAARGDWATAIARLEEAVRLEDALVYTEPAEWHSPQRLALATLLLEAGRPAEAETVYWEELRRTRDSGWALFGLVQALRAQGKQEQAAIAEARFRKAWARADITLTASRFGRPAGKAVAVAARQPSRKVAVVIHPVVE